MCNSLIHVRQFFPVSHILYTIGFLGCQIIDNLPDFKIPWDELSEGALMGIIEEFVTREGTEYGDSEISLEIKCQQVRQQLRDGDAFITFDEEVQTCSISPAN
ncbi:MAG: YheU family protein [Gammaproteobacteria bacterium]|nr:YheU family protein [Gammaproteobacteria bacterium]